MNEDLMYEEEPVVIIDYQVYQLRSKQIPKVKVLWRTNNIEEHTWETEAEIHVAYPYLFTIVKTCISYSIVKFQGRIFVKGEDCYNPYFFIT